MDIRNFFNKGKAGETANKTSTKTPPAKAKAPETQRQRNTPPVKKPATPSPAKKKTPARGKRAAVEDSESDDEVVEVKPTASRRSKYFPKEATKVAQGRGRRKVLSESEDDADNFAPTKQQVAEKDDKTENLEDDDEEEKPAARKPQARRKPAAQSNKRKAEAPAAAKKAKKPAAAKPEPQAEAPKLAQNSAGGGGGGGARWAGGKPPWMQERVPPPHKGEKEVPRGPDDCLAGLTFVLTGTLDSLERDEAEDLIKRHGGRITSAVSSRTTYVVTDMDPGGSKSKKAHELGTPIIAEDELFNMIRKASAAKPATKAATKAPLKPREKPNATSKDAGKAAVPAPGSKKRAALLLPDDNSQLWTTKYAPISTDDIIGNNAQVARLQDWLANWDSNRLGGTAEKKGAGSSKGKGRWGKGGDGSDKKAVLLYGSPGVGKTTAAHIVSEALGFIVFEVNASDTRNKAEKDIRNGMHGSTANIVKEMITNTALPFVKGDAVSDAGQGKALDGHMKKMVLVMDEVDGMSGGDRGGVADLIQSIHKSMVPIICICNDKYSQKIKSLLNHVLELEFKRPTKQQVARRLSWIASQEGLATNDAAIEKLVESVQSDIRLSLNVMQMWRTKSDKLQYDDVQAHMRSASKDMDISPFVAADRVFKSDSSLSLGDRINLVFYDADLVPLLIQENYINHRPFNARDECERMECISRAADSIADGDMVSRRIRRFQKWILMPAYAVMACVTPAMCVRGSREALHPSDFYNRFSAWLGKNSSEGKNKRLLQELCTHLLISGNFHTGRAGCRLDYMPVLREALTKPLREDGLSGVTKVVDTMNEYCITREDWQNILDITQFKGKPNPTEGVATNVKTAFTRTYNAKLAEHAVKSTVLLPELKVPGRKPKLTKRVTNLLESADGGDVAPARDDEVDIGSEGEEGDDDAQEEEEEIKPEYIPGVKVKGAGGRGKGAAASSRGRSTTSKRGGSGRGRGKSS